MNGYQGILRLRRLEDAVDKLGFVITAPKHGNWSDNLDQIGLKPKDAESVPIYARDAELFCGTLDQLNVWVNGVLWARNYDMMLKISDDSKRERKEQDLRNKHLVQRLKDEEVLQKG